MLFESDKGGRVSVILPGNHTNLQPVTRNL